MGMWSSNEKFCKQAAQALVLMAFLLPAARAGAEWAFESLSHEPAVAGQPLRIAVRLAGSGEEAVHVSAYVDQDPQYQSVIEAAPVAPGVREAVFEVPIGANAEGYWRFNFQLVVDGIGQARRPLFVQIHDTAPTPALTPTPAPVATATADPGTLFPPPADLNAVGTPGFSMTPPPFATPATAETTPMPTPIPPPLLAPLQTPVAVETPGADEIAATQPVEWWPATTRAAPGMPDLSVSFVAAPAEITGAVGEVRLLRYRVLNQGDAASSTTLVRFGSDLQSSFDRYSQPLEPGQEITGMVSFAIDMDQTEFWVTASARGASDPTPQDNRASRPVRLTPPSPYNVALSQFTVATPMETLREGDPIDVQFVLSNTGSQAITHPFTVSIEGFEGGTIAQVAEPILAAGASEIVRFRGWLPRGSSAKPTLNAMADAGEVLAESNEADNYASLAIETSSMAPPALVPTPTPEPAEQDVAILSLRVAPRRPVAGDPVLFFITTNRKTVEDVQGAEHDISEYLALDPRGDGAVQVPFVYNSTMPDPSGREVHHFVASYTYGRRDQGLERHARIHYAPPPPIPDANPANNAYTGIVQIGM